MIFILLLGRAALAPNAQEIPTFRAGISVVRVDAQVLEKERVVEGLGSEDFLVYDEGLPQRIEYFGRESEPLDLLLLLDVSGSMRRHVEELSRVAQEALHQLRMDDRVAVMVFSREAVLREEFTGDVARVTARLREIVRDRSISSWTAINPSTLSAAEYMGEELVRGRRAILILTDNSGLNYQSPDSAVIRALWEADCVLNAIVVGDRGRPEKLRPGAEANPDFTPPDVFRLAGQTGGEALRARRAGEAFRQMMERLRTRYSLHYRAPEAAPGSLREIRVELSSEARKRYPGAVIRARRGYHAQ